MKSRIALCTLVILSFLLASCATAAGTPPAAPVASQPESARSSAPATAADSFGGAPSGAKSNAAQPPETDRLVIKNADLTIVVADPAGGMSTIMTMANTMGGYVVSSKSYKTTSRDGVELPQAMVTVRVPAAKLDDALAANHKLVADPARDIQSENVTGQDVTADYVDKQSKLTSLQNTHDQLIKIQDSATKTEDVLAVFNQL